MKSLAGSVGTLLVVVQVLLSGGALHASTLSMGFDIEFTGASEPGGAKPWLMTVFDDADLPGSVRLTMMASGLVDSESVSQVYLNLQSEFDAEDLNFTFITALSDGPQALDIETGTDDFKAAKSGKYDILLEFPKGHGFDAGETVVYDITGVAGLTAGSFHALSKLKGSHAAYLAAAHVQGVSEDDAGEDSGSDSPSSWIAPLSAYASSPAVPIPAPVWLFGAGLFGMVGIARKAKREPV